MKRITFLFLIGFFCINGCTAVNLETAQKKAENELFLAEEAGANECAPIEMRAARKKADEAKELAKTSEGYEEARVSALAAAYLAERAREKSMALGEQCPKAKKKESENEATPASVIETESPATAQDIKD